MLLILDDAAEARRLLELVGETASDGVTLVHEREWHSALARAAAEDFDAVLIDLTAPGSDLDEVLARILSVAPDLPIVVLTDLDDEERALRAIPRGAQDYLVKDGITGRRLVHAVRYAVERRRIERRMQETLEGFRTLIEASFSGVVMHVEGRVVEASADFARTFGYGLDEVIGKTVMELVAPESRSLVGRMIGVDAEEPYEFVGLKADGTRFPAEVIGRTLPSSAHKARVAAVRDLSQRKRAEQHMEGLTLAVAQSPAAVVITDMDARIEYVNPRFTEITGYTLDEVMGQNPRILKSGRTPDEVYQSLWAALAAGKAWRGEFQNRRKNGESYWVAASISPLRDSAGSVIKYVAVEQDVTERKRAEEELREREQRLSSVYDTVGDVIYHLAVEPDGEYRFVSVNSAFTRITGIPADEVIGKLVNDIIPEPSLSAVLARYAEAIRERKTVRWEETSMYPTGTLTGEVSVAPVVDKTGQATHLVGAVHDVTARKRGEEALRESDERFRQVTEHIKEAFYLLDLETRSPLYVSPVWAEIWGRDMRDAYDPDVWYEAIHPEDQAGVQADTEAVARGESSVSMFRVIRPNETVRWVRGRAFPVRDNQGKVYRLVGVAEDITEQRSLEAQFRQAQKMEAVGRLAGGVAHDFNNLLTAIAGYADFVTQSLPVDDPVQLDVDEIRKAGARATALTRQLLAFSRQQVLEPRVLGLNELVRGLEHMLQRLLGEDIDLVTALGEDTGNVKADPGQLEQVIVNLAVNARDAMPDGGKLTIETALVEMHESHEQEFAAMPPGRYALLAVSDTGVGMDESTRSQIFEPFFTTKGPGKGTGLGLSTVYGIVSQSGGFVSVYSEPGHGSTFKVYLLQVEQRAASGADSEQVAARGGVEVVLLVEDEAAVRTLTEKVLRRFGYEVLAAANGEEALLLCERHQARIQLLVTDVVMPGMSGAELAERVRGHCPGAAVLFMSGYTDRAAERQRLVEPGTAFLQKPFSPETLARKVRQVLDEASE